MDAARQLPELVDRVPQLRDRLVELAGEAIRSDPLHLSGILEADRDPGQVLLRPVMQRALDASTLRIAGGDQSCPRRAQLGQLGGQQVGELAVLDVCRQGRVDLFGRVASGEPRRDRWKRPALRAEAQRPEQEGERHDGPSGGNEPVGERRGSAREWSSIDVPNAVDHAVSAASTAAKPMATTEATITGPMTARVSDWLPASRRTDRTATAITAARTATLAHSSTNSNAAALSKMASGFDGPPNSGYVLGGSRKRRRLALRTRKAERQNGHRHAAGPVEGDRGEGQGQEGQGDVVVALEGEAEDPHRLEAPSARSCRATRAPRRGRGSARFGTSAGAARRSRRRRGRAAPATCRSRGISAAHPPRPRRSASPARTGP